MTLYTIMPTEAIFEQPDSATGIETEEMFQIDGLSFYGVKMSDGSIRVNRINSTNPQDYLRAEFSPGQFIRS